MCSSDTRLWLDSVIVVVVVVVFVVSVAKSYPRSLDSTWAPVPLLSGLLRLMSTGG